MAMRSSLLILLLLGSALAKAASFDCGKAKSPQEKAICTSPELSAADEQLAAAYKAWLAAVPPGIVAEVREDERGWLRKLAVTCKAEEASTPALADCMLNQYSSRIKELKGKTLTLAGVTFYWRSNTVKQVDDPDTGPAGAQGEINPGFGTLNATWPQSNSATPEWTAWNSAIEAAVQGMTGPGVKDGSGKVTTQWVAMAGVDAQVTASVGVVGTELVTATIENLWDGHGAHPNINSIQFNWMLKQRRELRAEDVFRTGSGWEHFLQKRCDQYLHAQLDHDGQSYESFEQPGEMAKTLHGIVVASENWQLNADGLTMIFPDYAVACHACKPPPVTIAWDELRPYLRAEFAIPQ